MKKLIIVLLIILIISIAFNLNQAIKIIDDSCDADEMGILSFLFAVPVMAQEIPKVFEEFREMLLARPAVAALSDHVDPNLWLYVSDADILFDTESSWDIVIDGNHVALDEHIEEYVKRQALDEKVIRALELAFENLSRCTGYFGDNFLNVRGYVITPEPMDQEDRDLLFIKKVLEEYRGVVERKKHY